MALAEHPALALAVSSATIASAVLAAIALWPKGDSQPLVDHGGQPSATDLAVDFQVFDPGVTQFVVPFDAPLSEFPWKANPGCTPEQREWLAANGVERQLAWLVDVRSQADGSDGSVTLRDPRIDGGPPPVRSDDTFLFDCPSAGMSDYIEVFQPLTESRAGFTYTDQGAKRPVAVNLTPGELVSLKVVFLGPQGFNGDLTAEVIAGRDTERVVLIPELHLPALGADLEVSVGSSPGGLFNCEDFAQQHFATCSAEDISKQDLPWLE